MCSYLVYVAIATRECSATQHSFQFYTGAGCWRISVYLVMGGIENFLSRLLKDKIPRYHRYIAIQ